MRSAAQRSAHSTESTPAEAGPCGITDDCLDESRWRNDACDGCTAEGGPGAEGAYWPPGLGGPTGGYWSSSSFTAGTRGAAAWDVSFSNGFVSSDNKATFEGAVVDNKGHLANLSIPAATKYVRCVRRGP